MGQKIVSKERSLKFKFPDLVKEWHPIKNKLSHNLYFPSSNHKVWWKCNKGHEWEATLWRRTVKKSKCPICSFRGLSQKFNFKVLYPKISKEWDYKKNNKISAEFIHPKSHKNVWWKCSKGHEFKMRVADRAIGKNCSICAGKKIIKENSFKYLFPEIAREWNHKKNKELKPENIGKGYYKKVWWKCKKNHEWQVTVNQRTNGKTKCPYCSGLYVTKETSLKFKQIELCKEWDYKKNYPLKPDDVTEFTTRKVWWRCPKNHSYFSSIANRTNRQSGCPFCSNQSSKGEFRILSELEYFFKKIHHRYKFLNKEIDVYIEDINIGIEFDGAYFHKNKLKKDLYKSNFFLKHKLPIIRVRVSPLSKILKNDIIVKKDALTKKDLNKIVKKISTIAKKKILKINKYLNKKEFVGEKKFQKYLSFKKMPLPIKSLNSHMAKKEWDYKRNYPLTPAHFTLSSHQSVWWVCSKKKHSFKNKIVNRTSSRTKLHCPLC